MARILMIICIMALFACESEKIPYHCGINGSEDVSLKDFSGDISDRADSPIIDTRSYPAPNDAPDTGLSDSDYIDADTRDISLSDVKGADVISGKPCSRIGVTTECGADESCYPFVECGGICRKCGNSTAGSNCEIHSDCKCGMACLSLTDRKLTCYKVCQDNTDCPSGQTCTDGWGEKYEHEYYKICKGLNNKTEEGK